MHTQLTPDRIMQTGLGFWPAKTLFSAIELGVLTELARGPEGFAALSRPARAAPAIGAGLSRHADRARIPDA